MKINFLIPQSIQALRIIGLVCLMLFGSSCSALISPPAAEEESETSDCLWRATGEAWNDENQDGVWNSNETPLANVKFWVDDTLNKYQKVNEFLSDTVSSNSRGQVEISVWLPGCPKVAFEVYTDAPQNCELTTEERIPVVNLSIKDSIYSFGFVCR